MTAPAHQPDSIPPELWRRLMRHLGTPEVDWECLLSLLEQQKSGRLELHIKDGQAQGGHLYLALRSRVD